MNKADQIDWAKLPTDDLDIVLKVLQFMATDCFDLYPFDEHFGIKQSCLKDCLRAWLSPTDNDWMIVTCMYLAREGEGFSKVDFEEVWQDRLRVSRDEFDEIYRRLMYFISRETKLEGVIALIYDEYINTGLQATT